MTGPGYQPFELGDVGPTQVADWLDPEDEDSRAITFVAPDVSYN